MSLARALAVDPQVVLLDEPFSALDAPVRADLRRELRRLQREVNLSTVIVTHDPEDAAMLADEIVVLGDGRVLQSGRCRDVYQRPATTEIGRLLGIGNLFAGVAGPPPSGGRRRGAPTLPAVIAGALPAGTPLLWQVPPEALHVISAPTSARTGGSSADLGPGRISDVIDLGRTVEIVVVLAGGDELRARTSLLPDLRVGADCHVEAAADAISVWAQTLEPEPEPTSGHR